MIGNIVEIRNTHFIFRTNFAGDPSKDRFKDSRRKASIMIPDEDLAHELLEAGFNVKRTKPAEDSDFPPVYYVNVIANFNSRVQPRIFLVCGDEEPRKLDEDSVGILDDIRVDKVNVILNPWVRDQFHSLYITTMYVEQKTDYDPFAEEYERRRAGEEEEPF